MTGWRPGIGAGLRRAALAARARRHALPLALVAAAALVGQAATLIQTTRYAQWPDTAQYFAGAERILRSGQLFDPVRTPGYPLFLAAIFAAAGHPSVRAVVLAQAAVMVLTALEVYALAYRVAGRRWVAGAIGVAIGANLLILDWERLALTETLACWLTVSLALTFERYVRGGRTRTLIGLVLLLAGAILTRPIFLYVPIVFFAVLALRAARLGHYARIRDRLAPALAAVYGLVALYAVGNGLAFGYYGLSTVGTVNLLGKAMELHRLNGMPLTGAGPRYAALQADVLAYVARGGANPWRFIGAHPQYEGQFLSLYAGYAIRLLERHPLAYVSGALHDIFIGWTARPEIWAPYTVHGLWITALMKLSGAENRAFLALPLLLVGLPVALWRRPADGRVATLCALALMVAGQIVTGGAADYTEFYRLRMPVDWAAICVAALVALEVARATLRAAGRRLGGRAGRGGPGEWMSGRGVTRRGRRAGTER